MKVAIIGSREKGWSHPMWCRVLIRRWLIKYHQKIDLVVSGGANGVDSWAAEYAKSIGIPVEEFPAEWRKPDGTYDKGAGFKRNIKIVLAVDHVVAFWNRRSKGTEHTINIARSEGKTVTIIEPELLVPDDWEEELVPWEYAL